MERGGWSVVAGAGLDSRGSEFKNIHRRVSTSNFSPGGLLLGAQSSLYEVHHSLFISACALWLTCQGFTTDDSVIAFKRKYENGAEI